MKSSKRFVRMMLVILLLLLANTSIVSAQKIKKSTKNEYVIDSLALKDYAYRITKSEEYKRLSKTYRITIDEKDKTINLLNKKIGVFVRNEERYEKIILEDSKKDETENKLAKEKLRITKRQRNTAYIVTVCVTVVSILLLTK